MIAVLSSNFIRTEKWLIETKGKGGVYNKSVGILKTIEGKEYFIVNSIEKIFGWEFESYEKAPDYETLEDLVKTRIK